MVHLGSVSPVISMFLREKKNHYYFENFTRDYCTYLLSIPTLPHSLGWAECREAAPHRAELQDALHLVGPGSLVALASPDVTVCSMQALSSLCGLPLASQDESGTFLRPGLACQTLTASVLWASDHPESCV